MSPSTVTSTVTSTSKPAINPHSGYHWRGQSTRFFEGWYFRLTLPKAAQTFAFMYSIDDPAGGSDYSGGVAQILGPDETYYCRTFPDVEQFWAWPHRLGLGHINRSQKSRLKKSSTGAYGSNRARYVSPTHFLSNISEGYQATTHRHQGRLLSPAGDPVAEWDYQIEPVVGWGTPNEKATAGWLSYLPVFEPGWQVLMAHGLASGWAWWKGDRYTFSQAPAYAEKNWGGAFPAKWFWLQCNAFADEPGLTVTAAGGVRDVLTWKENVGLIGIHYQGRFYEFVSTKTHFSWAIDPWGRWQLNAKSYRHRVEITGIAHDEGAWVRVPTSEGMQWQCRDTTHGELRIRLWAVSGDRSIIDSTSTLAGLEVGGGPWEAPWLFGQCSKQNDLL